ncbi:MAG: SRPBCC domain-containing protein [Flavisolibacter sp.]
MDYRAMIQTDLASASAVLSYEGRPDAGMLAWLDSQELKQWWRADTAMIEPFEGGMFFLTWKEGMSDKQHALYGIVEKVDTENNIIDITKIMYVSPILKIGHIHLHLHFEYEGMNRTRMTMVNRHNCSGQLLHLYNNTILETWPKAMDLLKKYLENKLTSFSSC